MTSCPLNSIFQKPKFSLLDTWTSYFLDMQWKYNCCSHKHHVIIHVTRWNCMLPTLLRANLSVRLNLLKKNIISSVICVIQVHELSKREFLEGGMQGFPFCDISDPEDKVCTKVERIWPESDLAVLPRVVLGKEVGESWKGHRIRISQRDWESERKRWASNRHWARTPNAQVPILSDKPDYVWLIPELVSGCIKNLHVRLI